ncbi:lipoyl synthase [Nocardioides immobilis]|uniref:Lipoyl synthase n=1 Tax=Nocardioides immobilis TaxID=2049295 RepID=A0A417XWQ4_9ACTN|nr:lipoyl synthase [Nocardioides immobilis]RHW24954.1 lipoyl synthase [Nocardioides immobilis]
MAIAADGRRLLRLEVRNSATDSPPKPPWLRTRVHWGPKADELASITSERNLVTVCKEAGCPNIYECWEDREATFLIGGDRCTRRCDFCQIDTGKPEKLDLGEPAQVADAVCEMGLKYATVTGVARDDLPDGGAWLYAETVRQIHRRAQIPVELLIPDFSGRETQLDEVFASEPEVLAHNIETVPRIFRRVRPGFSYERSLEVLQRSRTQGLVTKSNLILGMGETEDEIAVALRDLRSAGTELVTITQYLRPSPRHHPVDRWVTPDEFLQWQTFASDMGFAGVMSGPLVRSSYRAGTLYRAAIQERAGRAGPS